MTRCRSNIEIKRDVNESGKTSAVFVEKVIGGTSVDDDWKCISTSHRVSCVGE